MVTMMVIGVATVSAEPAEVVVSDESCVVIESDGNGGLKLKTIPGRMRVFTNNANGNELWKCTGKGVLNDTGRALVFDLDSGYECSNLSTYTERWHQTLSANGNFTLICIFKDFFNYLDPKY